MITVTLVDSQLRDIVRSNPLPVLSLAQIRAIPDYEVVLEPKRKEVWREIIGFRMWEGDRVIESGVFTGSPLTAYGPGMNGSKGDVVHVLLT